MPRGNDKTPKRAALSGENARRGQGKHAVASPGTDEKRKLVFTFHEVDTGGSWQMTQIQQSDISALFDKLSHVSRLTVQEAFTCRLLATIGVEKFRNKNAKRRLQNNYNGLDSLTELRVQQSGALRLHGRLEENVFSVIWWDPAHQVHPEGKNVR